MCSIDNFHLKKTIHQPVHALSTEPFPSSLHISIPRDPRSRKLLWYPSEKIRYHKSVFAYSLTFKSKDKKENGHLKE